MTNRKLPVRKPDSEWLRGKIKFWQESDHYICVLPFADNKNIIVACEGQFPAPGKSQTEMMTEIFALLLDKLHGASTKN